MFLILMKCQKGFVCYVIFLPVVFCGFSCLADWKTDLENNINGVIKVENFDNYDDGDSHNYKEEGGIDCWSLHSPFFLDLASSS